MEEKSRMIGNDSESNGFLVGLIMKVAIALESKNVKDMREMALELEGWELKEEEMDVKTKLFVEHILLAFSRVEIGLGVLDIAAEELTKVRDKMRVEGDKKAAEEFLDSVSECNCSICKSSKCGKCKRVIDNENSKIFSDYGICKRCYSEEPNIDEIYKDESIVPKSKYAGAPYDQEEDEERIRKALDRQDKLAKKKCSWGIDGCDCMQECCNKCGRWVDNDSAKIFKDYGICRKCYEDEPNIDEIYKDETIQPKGWDEREKRLSDVHKKIDELKKNFGFRDKKRIDWNRYHKKRRGRFKKDELSDEDKDDLK